MDKLDVAKNGAFALETSLTGLYEGLKLEFKGDDTFKADLGVVYKAQLATATAELDLAEFSSLKASVLARQGPISVGASTKLALGDKVDVVKAIDVCATYTPPSNNIVAALQVTDRFAKYALSVAYLAGGNYLLSGLFNFSPEKSSSSVTLGGSYKWCSALTLKGKVNNEGTVGVAAKYTASPTCTISSAAEFPSKDFGAFKVGVTASLG